MHPRPNNRAERRQRLQRPRTVRDRADWLATRSARQRGQARRLRWQCVRRLEGVRARTAYHNGYYPGRNVWRG